MNPKDEVVIKVENVSKDFKLPQDKVDSLKGAFVGMLKLGKRRIDTLHALENISLEIKKGEFFGIVGRNGSGKSTLLKVLASIYQPTEGKVSTYGKLVPFIELGVGFNYELTGKENVYLNGAILGFSRREIEEMYPSIVEFAELEKFMDQKLKNYSSGMQVRLAFSLAVRANADILLIDEVLAVGDSDFQRKCYEYFRSLKKEKKTVVFVTHDMSAIKEFCDRAALIESSKIQKISTPIEISELYDRLFYKHSKISDTPSERWGKGTMKVTDLKLSKTTLTGEDDNVKLNVSIKSIAPNKHFMTGFRVVNSTGQCMHETNTWNEEIKTPALKANEISQIAWEFPNIYVDGKYTIDVYAYDSKGEVADNWRGAAAFVVKRPLAKGFLIIPKITGQIVK